MKFVSKGLITALVTIMLLITASAITLESVENANIADVNTLECAMLQGEMDNHLGYTSNDHGSKDTDNRRNGYIGKTVRSSFGEIPVSVPRDRDGSFEPQVIPKRSKDITGIEDRSCPCMDVV
mgnify:CR=1 FL=1